MSRNRPSRGWALRARPAKRAKPDWRPAKRASPAGLCLLGRPPGKSIGGFRLSVPKGPFRTLDRQPKGDKANTRDEVRWWRRTDGQGASPARKGPVSGRRRLACQGWAKPIGRSPTPKAPLTREGPPVKSAATTEQPWRPVNPPTTRPATRTTRRRQSQRPAQPEGQRPGQPEGHNASRQKAGKAPAKHQEVRRSA